MSSTFDIPNSPPPAVYASAVDAVAPGLTDIVASNRSPGESWTDTLQRLLPILATTYQQKQLLDVQVERARNGQPPLDASMYAPGVQVGLSADTTKTLMMLGGAALLALVFLSRRRR